MKDDFRKYATQHLGMNSLVLDEVIKSQVSREWVAVDYMAMTSTTAGDEE